MHMHTRMYNLTTNCYTKEIKGAIQHVHSISILTSLLYKSVTTQYVRVGNHHAFCLRCLPPKSGCNVQLPQMWKVNNWGTLYESYKQVVFPRPFPSSLLNGLATQE